MEYGALTSRYWFAAASSFVRVRMLHFWSGLLSQEANACFNPKPCSFSVQAYLSRISGPLLDRIDIITEVPSLHFDELRSTTVPESSAVVKQRVETARAIQRERFKGTSCRCNANMQTPELRRFCELDETGALLMQQAFESLGLTARSYDRIRRVARTIADLAGSESILPEHLSEAIQYRTHQLIQN